MTSRVQLIITREGWYYLFVLLFIIGGAVLREVNLLVLLAGLMIGPLLFNWRLLVRGMRRLSVDRQIPRRSQAGAPLRAVLPVHNAARRPAWLVHVHDQIVRADQSERVRAESMLGYLPPGVTNAHYRLLLSHRGRYRLGPLRLTCRFPFGLMRGTVVCEVPDELVIWPRIGRLNRVWRQQLQGKQLGAQPNRARRGDDGEFYALRSFSSGDSLRLIHWRSTARVGDPMVKQSERLERNDVSLVLDLPPDSEPGAAELAIRLAATLVVELCREGGGELTFTLPGQPPQSWRAPPSRRFAEQLLDELAVVVVGQQQGDLFAAIEHARQSAPSATAVVISTQPDCRDQMTPAAGARLWLQRARWVCVGESLRGLYEDQPQPAEQQRDEEQRYATV
jgi:uncharacterized protein (DUF58 family)